MSVHTWTSSGSGSGSELIKYSTCFAFTTRSLTSSFLFAMSHNQLKRDRIYQTPCPPSKISGESNFSGFLCFVIGMSGLT